MGHAVGLHPVAAIMALVVGAKMFGALGALLATPAVAVTWVVIASIYRSARGESPDVMLSRKRAPWTLRRPTRLMYRGKRPGDEPGDSHDYANADPPVDENLAMDTAPYNQYTQYGGGARTHGLVKRAPTP